MPLDFGTIAARGINTAIAGQAPTIQSNLTNVPGLQKRINLFTGQMEDPMSEEEMAGLFGQQSAQAGLRGQAQSPAQILQNVFGVQAQRRDIQNTAAQNLGQATQFMQLNPFQPSEGVQGALSAESQNEQIAAQDALQSRALGRGPGGPSTLSQFAGMAAGALAPSLMPRGDMNPSQLAALRMYGAGVGGQLGGQFFR